MRQQTNMFLMKEQEKTPGKKKKSEVEIGNLPKEGFWVMIIKMIRDSGGEWMHRKVRIFKQKVRKCKKQQVAVTTSVLWSVQQSWLIQT